MTLTSLHPGATVDEVRDATGWDVKVSDDLIETLAPTGEELAFLRRLYANSGSMARD
jgi:glutaconate CoA-transferase subunit B